MTKKQARPDLERMISLGRKGIIDPDHMVRWEQFKKEWVEADLLIWEGLKKRIKEDGSGTLKLSPPLSPSEMKWAKEFIQRAEERRLC